MLLSLKYREIRPLNNAQATHAQRPKSGGHEFEAWGHGWCYTEVRARHVAEFRDL